MLATITSATPQVFKTSYWHCQGVNCAEVVERISPTALVEACNDACQDRQVKIRIVGLVTQQRASLFFRGLAVLLLKTEQEWSTVNATVTINQAPLLNRLPSSASPSSSQRSAWQRRKIFNHYRF